MKKRIFAVLLAFTLAGSFVACGGSKEGAETETVADESISDLSIADTTAETESNAADQTETNVPAGQTDQSTAQTPEAGIITPIPAVNLTDGSQAIEETADGAAANGASTDGSADSSAISPETPRTMIVTADINVREGADIEADILGGYEEGEEISVTGSEGDWYIVDYYGETGYVNSQYVIMPEETSSSSSEDTSSDSAYSEYGKLIDGDGDPVDLRYYDGSYEIYDENGNEVIIEGLND